MIDPVLESQSASVRTRLPAANELIFLGRYRLTSSAPSGFPSTCPTRETRTSPLCRFEVIVRDNDLNRPRRRATSSRSSCRAGPCWMMSSIPRRVLHPGRPLPGGNLTVD